MQLMRLNFINSLCLPSSNISNSDIDKFNYVNFMKLLLKITNKDSKKLIKYIKLKKMSFDYIDKCYLHKF